eukprot:TRINITY_DN63091_c0_g1_i1.p1 TRINITY_DN63091_c0_g1~~TRINITY_DN63091_c0_g1_i1.p1  ORF type:complete len:249 (-),score=31.84 TRINITY_DN63091_c0_g1_i1:201-878(-)
MVLLDGSPVPSERHSRSRVSSPAPSVRSMIRKSTADIETVTIPEEPNGSDGNADNKINNALSHSLKPEARTPKKRRPHPAFLEMRRLKTCVRRRRAAAAVGAMGVFLVIPAVVGMFVIFKAAFLSGAPSRQGALREVANLSDDVAKIDASLVGVGGAAAVDVSGIPRIPIVLDAAAFSSDHLSRDGRDTASHHPLKLVGAVVFPSIGAVSCVIFAWSLWTDGTGT